VTLLIGIPARRTVPIEFVRAVFGLQLSHPSLAVLQEGYAIAAQRNQLVSDALQQPEVETILFLDDDMLVPPDLVRRLLAHQRAIVGALYYARVPPFRALAGRYDPAAASPYQVVAPHTGLQPVDYVGAGALLVRTTVFRELPGPEWFLHGVEEHQGRPRAVAEDEWFCRTARQAGYGVFCDTDLIVPHLAALPIDERRAAALRSSGSALDIPGPPPKGRLDT
jgi:hypothetical protein